ncbi:spermatogenesis-associated protein 20 isoform X1 [Lepeophtheirus salmonis]|nr:spermatogenesis-associated protein 20-like isoform X2 [Lepeophtheirus salmonis]XP_040572200.1 spermatogenesis-associated protein 20-like isoform X2 [Lepeophtheirus salmonis]
MSSTTSKTNHLFSEKSPYLLQHAYNPVDWYPWGNEAFEEAKNKDKMIFLSVGYSTCHWCHVMERESFENEDIAQIMNELFVNIKVDREERPDVDQVYMSFVTATSGSGGWPMSVFLTPDLKPVFGGTYFPPEDMPYIRRPGFKTVLRSIHSQWINDRPKVDEAGETITKLLEKQTEKSAITCSRKIPTSDATSLKCFSVLNHSWDPQYGGFSRAPKFPQPVNLNLLFFLIADGSDYSDRAIQMIRKTLDSMAEGGIWDHISKGFARYSTDAEWHVPHFEKMLYDQGQLLVSYAQGYSVTKDIKYKRIVEDTIEYAMRDLQHSLSGGFYSGEDADSKIEHGSDEKREGAFCTWTYDEIKSIFKDRPDLFDACSETYDFKDGGNTSSDILAGQNVLRLKRNAKINRELILEVNDMMYKFRRENRPMPHLDDKVISAWNGLMISGLCYSGIALNNSNYIDEAIRTGEFILKYLVTRGDNGVDLMRTVYRNADNHDEIIEAEHPISGFIEDYAFVIKSFLDLYDVTFDEKWLNISKELQLSQDRLFWDEIDGGYFSSRSDDSSIIVRMKNSSDGAEPCGNSISVCNCVRLNGYFPEWNPVDKAQKTLEYFSEMLNKHPAVAPEMSRSLLFYDKHISLQIPEITIRKDMLMNVLQIIPLGSPFILKETKDEKFTFCYKGTCQDLGSNDGDALRKLDEYFSL